MKKKLPIYESLPFAMILAMAGGYFDGYTYSIRDARFASMETGNLILMMFNLFNKDYLNAILYLIPIGSYLLGIFVAILLFKLLRKDKIISYKQWILLFEIILVIGASLVPIKSELNIISTSLLGFASALQLESFKSVHYISYVSNMCTGNIAKMGQGFSNAILDKDKKGLRQGIYFLSIIISFALGALISFYLSSVFASISILFSLPLLALDFFLLFIKEKEGKPYIVQ